MSNAAERVGIIRTGMDAYARGDMPAVLALLDADVELYSPPELGNSPAAIRGHDGYLRWLSAWLEAWEDYEVEVERVEAVGERHVVADCRQRAIGRESRIPVEFVLAYMWEIPERAVTAFHLYRTWDEAVATAMRREADADAGVT